MESSCKLRITLTSFQQQRNRKMKDTAAQRRGAVQFVLDIYSLLCWYGGHEDQRGNHLSRDWDLFPVLRRVLSDISFSRMTMMTMNDAYRKFIEAVAREAGALLREKIHDRHTVRYKGEINLVTEADRLSEALIVERIRREFSGHDILTEESPETANGSDLRWIIDPLDGTTNYVHGYPVFCVSIALEIKGVIMLGAVYDPMLDELFMVEKGAGAFLNGRRLTVSRTEALSRGLLATGFPYDIREDRNNNVNYFKVMALSAQAVRRTGSAALDLAYVAAGRFDGFWELKLMPWDTAASWLLVEEAGGAVTDLRGGPYNLYSSNILASNGLLHAEMARLLAGTDPIYAP
jgi:myo-inositol-1(or 4)-monophosphatase